ncbi:Holliday junction resolvase RuvX [bacterium]|nr:MAG: Holliday junction resolvase RuvX [bacterium]
MKVLGIDYGTKRIGLAISDETQTLARELAIVSPEEFWQQIDGLIEEQGVSIIALGLPLNMSGEATQKSAEVQEFSDKLQQRLTIPVEMVDERLSSVMAEQITGSGEQIDSLAAQIFLQNYLNKNKQ